MERFAERLNGKNRVRLPQKQCFTKALLDDLKHHLTACPAQSSNALKLGSRAAAVWEEAQIKVATTRAPKRALGNLYAGRHCAGAAYG